MAHTEPPNSTPTEKLLNTLDEQLAAAEALTLAAELDRPAARRVVRPPRGRRVPHGPRRAQAHVLAQEAAR